MSLRGRASRDASPGRNLLKTLVQTVLFWGLFLAALPAGLWRLEPLVGLESFRFAPQPAVGWTLFGACGAIGLWSGAVMALAGRGTPVPFDCPSRLVVAGPYRVIRNPMVIAGLGQGVGIGVAFGSATIIVYALAGAPVWNWLVRPWEERDLCERFGDEYARYRQSVRCWIPRLTPFR